jgi:hypothetical protein
MSQSVSGSNFHRVSSIQLVSVSSSPKAIRVIVPVVPVNANVNPSEAASSVPISLFSPSSSSNKETPISLASPMSPNPNDLVPSEPARSASSLACQRKTMSGNLSFDGKCSPRTPRRNHIPKPLKFNDWVCLYYRVSLTLVTPLTLQRKRHRLALKRRRYESQKNAAQEYAALIASRVKEEKAKKSEIKKRRASSRRISHAPAA